MSDQIQNVLNLIVRTTEQSGNMKKGLKQTIFETISTFRNLFVKLTDSRHSKTTYDSKMEIQVIKLQAEREECSGKHAKEHGTPTLIDCQEAADTMAKEHGTPSLKHCKEPARMTRRVTLPDGRGGKLYSEAVGGENLKRIKLTGRSRDNKSPETIKNY